MNIIRHGLLTATLSLTFFSSFAQSRSLAEQIFLEMPDSLIHTDKAGREVMLKGGKELSDLDFEPINEDEYPHGVMVQKGNYMYAVSSVEKTIDLKIWDTNNADEKLVSYREANPYIDYKIDFFIYSVKNHSFKKQILQLPYPELEDVASGATIKEKNIYNGNKYTYGNSLVFKDFSTADGAIWQSINDLIFSLEGMENSKITPKFSYFYWNGTKFVKAENKQADVSEIRKDYTEVTKNLNNYQKSIKKSTETVAAIGPQTRVYSLFEKNGKLKFATQKFNVAARDFYEEYLYDTDGQLIFCYRRYPEIDGSMNELRFYFKNGLLTKSLVKVKKDGEKSYSTTYEGSGIPNSDCMFNYREMLNENLQIKSMK